MKLIPYTSLGRVQHGWLDARHHFSFGQYHDEDRMGFGTVRVVNDDQIAAGAGFDTHPHRDMEIITFVRHGAITHQDSLGNHGRTQAGDVQVMSAGTGVYHSESNQEDETTTLYQIWITPNKKGVKPKWDGAAFPKQPGEHLSLLVAGDGSAPLHIHQDAFIYGGVLQQGVALTQKLHHQAYILISKGEVKAGDTIAKAGDALEVTASTVTLQVLEESELIIIDAPKA